MNIRVFAASALALAVFVPAANALTIVDRDKTAYTIKVTPTGGKHMKLAIKAGAKATVDCRAGCRLSLNGKTRKIDSKLARIVIKGGKFTM